MMRIPKSSNQTIQETVPVTDDHADGIIHRTEPCRYTVEIGVELLADRVVEPAVKGIFPQVVGNLVAPARRAAHHDPTKIR
jgi:hypothetical protein